MALVFVIALGLTLMRYQLGGRFCQAYGSSGARARCWRSSSRKRTCGYVVLAADAGIAPRGGGHDVKGAPHALSHSGQPAITCLSGCACRHSGTLFPKPVLRPLGQISYSLYLVHFPLFPPPRSGLGGLERVQAVRTCSSAWSHPSLPCLSAGFSIVSWRNLDMGWRGDWGRRHKEFFSRSFSFPLSKIENRHPKNYAVSPQRQP